MKNFFTFIFFTVVLLVIASDATSAPSRKKYFTRPQVGLWYGPVTPVQETAEHVDANLGGGAFMRYNLPYEPLKLGFDSSYQRYESRGVDSLRLLPNYFNLLYLLPFDFPVRFQIKAGAGWCNVHLEPDNVSQWDPMFMTGMEISFPAGQTFNIALRIDYLCIYEKHLEGAETNGYVINTGISLYLNLNL